MARSPNGRLRTPTKLTPMQGVSDTFARSAAGNRGKQIAEALGSFNQGISQLKSNYKQEKAKEERKLNAIEAAKSQERLVGATAEIKAIMDDPEVRRLSGDDFMGRDDVQAIIKKSTEGLSPDAAELLGLRLQERFTSSHSLAAKGQAQIDRVDNGSKFAGYTIHDKIDQLQSIGLTDEEIQAEMAPTFAAVERSLREEFGMSNTEVMEALKSVQARRGLDQKDAYLGDWILDQTWGGNGYKEDVTNLVYNAKNQRAATLREQGQSMFTPFEAKAVDGSLTNADYEQLDQMVEDGFISAAERSQIELVNTRERKQAEAAAFDLEAQHTAMGSALDGYIKQGYFVPVTYTKADGTEKTITAKELEDKYVADALKKFEGNVPAQLKFFLQNPTLKNPHWEKQGELLQTRFAAGDVEAVQETLHMFDQVWAANPQVLTNHLDGKDLMMYQDYKILASTLGTDKAAGMVVNSYGADRPEVTAKAAHEFADAFMAEVTDGAGGWLPASDANTAHLRNYAYKMWKSAGRYTHMNGEEFAEALSDQIQASSVEVNGTVVYTVDVNLAKVGGKEGFAEAATSYINELATKHPDFSAYEPEQISIFKSHRAPNLFQFAVNGSPMHLEAVTLNDLANLRINHKVTKRNNELAAQAEDIEDEVGKQLTRRGFR